MLVFDDLINTGLIGRTKRNRCFETTVVAVRNVVNRTADRHQDLTVHLESQFTNLVGLDRDELQRVNRGSHGCQFIAYEYP